MSLSFEKIQIFDGAMGSSLEERGLISENVEDLNITHADIIKEIHLSYNEADFITTNTFGLNKFKYKGNFSIEEVALKAIENAKVVGKKVFFDIGPTGLLMKPLGTLEFESAYECFREIVEITKDKVDGYIIETFSDLLEIKACVLAVKENSDKPVFATMTFASNLRTLTGTSVEIMCNTLEGLGVDVLGVNCSLGPIDLYPVVEKLVDCAHIPVLVQPNRGIPQYVDGKAYYDLGVDVFKEYTKKFIDLGVSIVGGCCGTNASFINAIACYKGLDATKKENDYKTLVNSRERLVDLDNVTICGERLNPTGKKRLKDAIVNEDYDYLIKEAIIQKDAGANVLDINVGVPLIDEVKILKNAIQKVSEYVNLPLQIDSSDYKAIEEAVRVYCGIPIINSVNGKKEVMDNIFRIAKKYGAVVIGLTLDEDGVPLDYKKRVAIAKKIIKYAEKYDIPKHKIIIDTLVLTASSNQKMVNHTLKALSEITNMGVKTTLGVSNVSFGLPNRQLLNKTFLSLALGSGLTMPIINPLDKEMMDTIKAYKVLSNKDINASEYITEFKNIEKGLEKTKIENDVFTMIEKGLKLEIAKQTEIELSKYDNPLMFIEEVLIKALFKVGDFYEKGMLYLPQLIASSEAAKIAFNTVLNKIPSSLVEKGNIIIGTVKGDIHDIGKNIVKVVLQSYGYSVIDLGKDVDSSVFVNAYRQYKPIAVGLSALMTTTINSMKETIKELKINDGSCKIFVGGAVLTQEIADKIGADYYCKTALDIVNILEHK